MPKFVPYFVVGAIVVLSSIAGSGLYYLYEKSETKQLCADTAVQILADAAKSDLEIGTYEAWLPEEDRWMSPLHSVLFVDELCNSVVVTSYGRDRILSDDDIAVQRIDLHKRKIVGQVLEESSRHIGKGLIEGAAEGAKEGFAKLLKKRDTTEKSP